jgi:hypothetical protein
MLMLDATGKLPMEGMLNDLLELVSVLPIYTLAGIGERSSHILVGWNW